MFIILVHIHKKKKKKGLGGLHYYAYTNQASVLEYFEHLQLL